MAPDCKAEDTEMAPDCIASPCPPHHRSYLVRQGPQFSIDAIVSVLFVLTCATWSWVCFQVIQTNAVLCAETTFILVFASLLGFFLMHIVWLGSEINNQFHDVITLFNEQIKCNTLAVQVKEDSA